MVITSETSWMTRLNGALDRISQLQKDRADALDALTALCREIPELDDNEHVLTARLALL